MSVNTKVSRHPERAVYDRTAIDAILDEALICHVGFVDDGYPYVIPTIHARAGDRLYVHGSPLSRMLGRLGAGADVCVTATLLDGVVLARSVFHHSMNYRSAVVFGRARAVEGAEEKHAALRAIVEHVVPGRSAEARQPSSKELAATSVLELPIDAGSAKVRQGPPADAAGDVVLPIWAGVVPLALVAREPVADSHVPPGIELPPSVARYACPSR